MKKCLFIFGVALLASVRSATTRFETVWLKDVTTRFSSDKRTFSVLVHPDELTFNLRRGSGDITLNLKRNYDIDPNADIYFARKSKDGQSVLVKAANFGNEDVAYYQDMDNGAFVTVRCVKRSNEQCDRDINGNIQIGNSSYDLRPAETEVSSRNLFEVPDLFAKRYVLQDQVHIQRENSVENKDAGNVNEKKVEEEFTAFFQRFEAQHKQTHGSFSHSTLSSPNKLVLHNSAATDGARQLKKDYYVKVAVLIDSETWNLYSSMVSSFNPLTRSRKVKRKIKESYSHVMNGVNLRYKGIQDSSISISIILSRFIYFKDGPPSSASIDRCNSSTKIIWPWCLNDKALVAKFQNGNNVIGRRTDFKHKKSKVIVDNGKHCIGDEEYIADLKSWDKDIGKRYTPSYDHAMLFTRYNLYDSSTKRFTNGLSYFDHVCKVGLRLSIIQANDYFVTTLRAAHELGHNLGASHDGEENATACKAEELFIMTPEEPKVDPATPLSRNLWIFSNCSVEAFKRNLNNKECVTHPGPLYDEQEYKEYVTKEPGEVYTPDDQCHVSAGPGSVYCGPVPVDSCYLKCTEPSRGRCQETFYHAARGTQCGQNMWCIESRCVPKLSDRSTASHFFVYQTRDHKDVGSNHAQSRQDRPQRGILWPKLQRATPSHV